MVEESRRGHRDEQWRQHFDQHIHLLERMLVAILRRVNLILKLEEWQMAAIDDLETEVSENTDVTSSAVVLLEGLSQQLKDAIASGDPARVQAVVTQLDANSKRLADAVTANTPVAPTP